MAKYFLDRNNLLRIALVGLKYGAIVGAITIATRYLFSMLERSQGNMLWLIVAFSILAVGQFYAFKVFNQQHTNRSLKFLPTLTVGLIFSCCVGAMAGTTHYIEATYIDPEWSMKAFEYAKATWLHNNYTSEAIAGQVEWTTTFHTPGNWAFQIAKFLILISLGLALLVIGFMKVSEELALKKA